VAVKERIGKRDHPRMMQLAVPKQNGCQKCVAQLDTKANERKGSPNSFQDDHRADRLGPLKAETGVRFP
jgi:hypothetical protein